MESKLLEPELEMVVGLEFVEQEQQLAEEVELFLP